MSRKHWEEATIDELSQKYLYPVARAIRNAVGNALLSRIDVTERVGYLGMNSSLVFIPVISQPHRSVETPPYAFELAQKLGIVP